MPEVPPRDETSLSHDRGDEGAAQAKYDKKSDDDKQSETEQEWWEGNLDRQTEAEASSTEETTVEARDVLDFMREAIGLDLDDEVCSRPHRYENMDICGAFSFQAECVFLEIESVHANGLEGRRGRAHYIKLPEQRTLSVVT